MAIYPSGWQVLLVSLISPHLQARSCIVICHTIFISLTTDINHVSQDPRVPAVPRDMGDRRARAVRVHYFLLLFVRQFPFVYSQWLL